MFLYKKKNCIGVENTWRIFEDHRISIILINKISPKMLVDKFK